MNPYCPPAYPSVDDAPISGDQARARHAEKHEKKAWLKKLATRSFSAWATSVQPAALDGIVRIETRRTLYRFEDGVCTAQLRRDGGTHDARVIGMRIVGWLLYDDEVATEWVPGARAILWRAEGPEGDSVVALTSPAFALLPTAPQSESRPRALPPALVVPPPPSRTRIQITA